MIPTAATEGIDVIRAGSGAPLALAHGAGGSVMANFGPMLEEFAGQRTMIGVNYPGSGTTPLGNSELALDDLADQLVAAMLATGYDRFPIAAISVGCAVAVTAAARHPQHVTGLALSVGFAQADVNLQELARVRGALLAARDTTTLARVLLLICSSPTTLAVLSMEEAENVVAQVSSALPEGAGAQMRLAARTDVRELAAGLSVPARVYVSGCDRIVLPSSTRALADSIPGAELVEYPEAGHIYTDTEARVWANDVRDFFTRHAL